MVKGIGVDIVSVARVQEALDRTEGFAERILTESELQKLAATKQKAHYLAKRFAAKEAAVKALGNGIGNGVSWHHIEVSNDEMGAPHLHLTGPAKELMTALGASQCKLSLSDERDNAIAFVVME
ncbi:UNVERIFIED_CONTAM: hypothetical protein GTU68_057026 [Idotea baltica]|nr:hypothetical protein [Idotea baltica]